MPVSKDDGTAVEEAGFEPRFSGALPRAGTIFWESGSDPFPSLRPEMPKRVGFSLWHRMGKAGGAAPFCGVVHLHDNEPFVPECSLLPRLIT